MFQAQLSAAECRHFAQECRRLATTAVTVEERIYLREREAAWNQLAETAEQRQPSLGANEESSDLIC